MTVARTLWQLIEPLHAVVYFAPEHRAAQQAAGLKGGWMAYFASRSAPLGRPSAGLVAAVFYNFAPAMVARSLPDAWSFASPAAVLQARYAGVGAALQRILGARADAEETQRAAELLDIAARSCAPAGRPMFAANAALDPPREVHRRLWHAATLLREHRGDGHVAALMAHGLDGCRAHLLAAAAGITTEEQLRPNRGWSDDEWEGARHTLIERRLITPQGGITSQGRRLHEDIERMTDDLAAGPWASLGPEWVAELRALLTPLRQMVDEAGVVPYPNAMGLPYPATD